MITTNTGTDNFNASAVNKLDRFGWMIKLYLQN